MSDALLCPACRSSQVFVIDTRATKSGEAIRRRRKCDACQHRFTTYETADKPDAVAAKAKSLKGRLQRAIRAAVKTVLADMRAH